MAPNKKLEQMIAVDVSILVDGVSSHQHFSGSIITVVTKQEKDPIPVISRTKRL